MQQHEKWRQSLLRTEETVKKYADFQKSKPTGAGCGLCNDKETITEFTHWRLMPNRFPYDRYFSKSDMLVTKRHINEEGINDEERAEFYQLRKDVLTDIYDSIIDHLPKQKSIPSHCHFHLIKFRRLDEM